MRFHARAAFVGTAIGVLVAGLWMSTMRAPTVHHHEK
jgi:hypothetical protein